MIRKLYYKFCYVFNQLRFGAFGHHSIIQCPLRIDGAKNIFIGENVGIHYHAWLGAVSRTGYQPKLEICDGTTIGDFVHIYATKSVIIKENVLIANFVYISDNIHGYKDLNLPIIKQSIVQKNEVVIGEGSWLGEHVCVIGASVGKHCIIGANAVVTHDIPDYCVAVGSPAKVIKRYCFETGNWINVSDSSLR